MLSFYLILIQLYCSCAKKSIVFYENRLKNIEFNISYIKISAKIHMTYIVSYLQGAEQTFLSSEEYA